jgi:nucleoid-associated protein EbfC
MNPMQQMIMEANRIQRELAKAKAELAVKEFVASKAGLVTVTVLGDRTVKSVKFSKDAVAPDNQEVLEETVALAINDALTQVEKAIGDINEKVTGRREGI